MADGVLGYEVAEGVATLTLNRPDKRNALDRTLVVALKEALERAGTDESVRVVALRGAGPDFCSGADLAELERIAEMGERESLADARFLGDLFVRMRRHPRPLVAVVHGHALAGGCGLATACDLVLAHEEAELGYPEVRLGFVPAMVMTILRRRVGEARAFELVARGHRVSAPEAERIGLVNRVFEGSSFDAEVGSYLEELAARPASAVRLAKGLLYELDELGFHDGIERAAEVNVEARRSDACREGVRRFLERRSRGS